MPAIKMKPEHWATFVIAGMLCLILILGGGKLSHALLPCFYVLWIGIGIVEDVKSSGKFNPYILHLKLKDIIKNRWVVLFIVWVIGFLLNCCEIHFE